MNPEIIKISKKEDLASVLHKLTAVKESEVVLEFEEGSKVLARKDSVQAIQRTAEVLNKSLAMVSDGRAVSMQPVKTRVELRTTPHPAGKRFSDIMAKPGAALIPKKVMETAGSFKAVPKLKLDPLKKRYVKTGILVGVALILILGILNLVLPRAEITAYARSEPITRDLEVTVDKSITQVDLDHLIIPGQLIKKEVSQTKNFTTTGKTLQGQKAVGKVTIYNFTSYTLTLRAATTTLVVSDRKYFFTKDVTGIRPTVKTSSGQIDKSSLIPPVPIVAAQVGETYNLVPQTKFTIQNSALGSRAAEVYALNDESISGGTAQALPTLSGEDWDKAVSVLTENALTQVSAGLGTDFKLLPTGTNKEILAQTADKQIGDQTSSFNMTLIARITGLAYQEGDLRNLLLAKIKEVLSSDKYLVLGAQQNLSADFKSADLVTGKGVLAVHFETVAAYKVDESNLTKILAGKNASEINEILLTRPEIDRVDVKFWPFYVHRAPSLNGKIYIKVQLSQS